MKELMELAWQHRHLCDPLAPAKWKAPKDEYKLGRDIGIFVQRGNFNVI